MSGITRLRTVVGLCVLSSLLVNCAPIHLSSRPKPATDQTADNPALNAYGMAIKHKTKTTTLSKKPGLTLNPNNTKTHYNFLTTSTYLKNKLSDYPDVKVYHRGSIVHIILPVDGLFEVNSYVLRTEGLPEMYELTSVIASYNPRQVYVTAFTDAVGDDDVKMTLSRHQAETIKGYMWAHGIPESIVKAVGYGKFPTVARNDISWGSRMNRRIEILFWVDAMPGNTL